MKIKNRLKAIALQILALQLSVLCLFPRGSLLIPVCPYVLTNRSGLTPESIPSELDLGASVGSSSDSGADVPIAGVTVAATEGVIVGRGARVAADASYKVGRIRTTLRCATT